MEEDPHVFHLISVNIFIINIVFYSNQSYFLIFFNKKLINRIKIKKNKFIN
jgi:hypothetical protein